MNPVSGTVDSGQYNGRMDAANEAVIKEIAARARERYDVRRLRPATRFTKVAAFWAPRRFVGSSGIDVEAFISELDTTIRTRGMVLYDGQVLTASLEENAESIESIFEPDCLDDALEVPARREWGAGQRDYFGVDDPYQMADEAEPFTFSHLVVSIAEPYLRPDEAIAALVHGQEDGRYLYCPCHSATVVYTTRQRVLCMSCGATHAVLREPLPIVPVCILSAEEWAALFDEQAARRDENVDLVMVDFREIENAELIWTTHQWEDAAHELVFFARSSPEDIEKATRGTEADPSIFMEAGWTRVDLPPPPALQLMPNSVEVDLVENAAHAFRDGAAEFISAYVRPERLVSAVPDLFRSIELLLKARLELVDAHALDDHPNNPTVLDRLERGRAGIAPGDIETVTGLRQLRNDLQHGSATFNHRKALSLCRRAVVFIDAFARDSLDLWIGDVVTGEEWRKLLVIPEVAATAHSVVTRRLTVHQDNSDAQITTCPQCGHDTMVRPHPASGTRCAYCDHVPVSRDA
jgi:ribosomal protein S27E